MRKLGPIKLALLASGRYAYEIAREVKMTETRLSRIANQRALPTREEAKRLAEALGISARDIPTRHVA